MTITTRASKGAPLTYAELDTNWTDLDGRTASGWRDMVSPVSAAGIPPNQAPALADFGPAATPQRREYSFGVGDYIFIQPFHVDHDIMPNGQALIHVHWSTNGTSTNAVNWEFSFMRALGHDQANFGAPSVLTIEQAANGTAWRHMVAEIDIANALTLTEPDELILVTLRRIAATGTENPDTVFALMVDLHYEVDRLATPNRSPNFYGV